MMLHRNFCHVSQLYWWKTLKTLRGNSNLVQVKLKWRALYNYTDSPQQDLRQICTRFRKHLWGPCKRLPDNKGPTNFEEICDGKLGICSCPYLFLAALGTLNLWPRAPRGRANQAFTFDPKGRETISPPSSNAHRKNNNPSTLTGAGHQWTIPTNRGHF